MKETINFTMIYKSASINATLQFDENDNEGTLTFSHPLTGSKTENINSVLWGWKEQNSKKQDEWEELVRLAKEFCNSELYWKINNGGVYNL
jgi:prephenate dehydrogenase